jgi:hypothetical protein
MRRDTREKKIGGEGEQKLKKNVFFLKRKNERQRVHEQGDFS